MEKMIFNESNREWEHFGGAIIAKPKEHTIYEKILLKKIKELNTNKGSSSLIVQVNETEAILIYWSKGRLDFSVYPFCQR